ncbi:hypothetical protein CcaverHIS002_0609280 [Cutaneotrichosporon cavernicola]|nr:hypothetical protein CcaverHIS002_0609280 [Cutaneotrichosporon cavernicola]
MFRKHLSTLTRIRSLIRHRTEIPTAMSATLSTTVTNSDAAAPTKGPPATAETSKAAEARPKLSPSEAYAWNAAWKGMERFHNSHKRTFTNSYEHASDYADVGYSLKAFLRESYNLVIHLGNHHSIEEAYIFPLLAHKHPAFRDGAEHKADHAAIHDGLERYQEFLRACMMDDTKYSPEKMREILDSFREPLFRHLDQEVEDLKPETLWKHGFTIDEIRRLPF